MREDVREEELREDVFGDLASLRLQLIILIESYFLLNKLTNIAKQDSYMARPIYYQNLQEIKMLTEEKSTATKEINNSSRMQCLRSATVAAQ